MILDQFQKCLLRSYWRGFEEEEEKVAKTDGDNFSEGVDNENRISAADLCRISPSLAKIVGETPAGFGPVKRSIAGRDEICRVEELGPRQFLADLSAIFAVQRPQNETLSSPLDTRDDDGGNDLLQEIEASFQTDEDEHVARQIEDLESALLFTTSCAQQSGTAARKRVASTDSREKRLAPRKRPFSDEQQGSEVGGEKEEKEVIVDDDEDEEQKLMALLLGALKETPIYPWKMPKFEVKPETGDGEREGENEEGERKKPAIFPFKAAHQNLLVKIEPPDEKEED